MEKNNKSIKSSKDETKKTPNKKIITFLKIFAVIQTIALLIVIALLAINIIDYKYFGELEFVKEPDKPAKCRVALDCNCKENSTKCVCSYYDDENNIVEKIECRPSANKK